MTVIERRYFSLNRRCLGEGGKVGVVIKHIDPLTGLEVTDLNRVPRHDLGDGVVVNYRRRRFRPGEVQDQIGLAALELFGDVLEGHRGLLSAKGFGLDDVRRGQPAAP